MQHNNFKFRFVIGDIFPQLFLLSTFAAFSTILQGLSGWVLHVRRMQLFFSNYWGKGATGMKMGSVPHSEKPLNLLTFLFKLGHIENSNSGSCSWFFEFGLIPDRMKFNFILFSKLFIIEYNSPIFLYLNRFLIHVFTTKQK